MSDEEIKVGDVVQLTREDRTAPQCPVGEAGVASWVGIPKWGRKVKRVGFKGRDTGKFWYVDQSNVQVLREEDDGNS
jgi:hypothetical protein